MLGVCRRILRNEADAEDAFQAVFLVLVHKAATIRCRKQLSNWLYGVAHNTALKAKAMIHKRARKEAESGAFRQAAAPEEVWRQVQSVLDTELSRLPDKYRIPIVLCELEGQPIKEAARQLGWPQGTLATRLARGRALLRRRLSHHGLELSGVVLAAALFHGAACAHVPPLLVSSTVKAALSVAAGSAATSTAVSAKVAVLTEGVLKTMLLTKLKIAMGLLLAAGVLAYGVGTLVPPAPATAQTVADNAKNRQPAAGGRVTQDTKSPIKLKEPTTWGTDASVDSIAFSPDGKRLAVQVRSWIDNNGQPMVTGSMLQVRDAASGEIKATLIEAAHSVSGAAWSSDGKLVATTTRPSGEKPLVKLYEASSGQEAAVLKGSTAGYLSDLAFSRDNRLLVAAGISAGGEQGGEIAVWEVPTGKLLWKNRDHTKQIHGVAISPDGILVATASMDKTIRLWDSRSGDLKSTLEGHEEPGVYSVAFSPDGKLLASGGLDGSVRLWDLANVTRDATAELKTTITGYTKNGNITRVAFTPDGKTLVTGGSPLNRAEGNIKLWNVKTGELRAISPESVPGFRSLALSPDGRTLAVGIWQKQLLLFTLR